MKASRASGVSMKWSEREESGTGVESGEGLEGERFTGGDL
jgi:hypothetical protein